mgnify:CR=1 FL=1
MDLSKRSNARTKQKTLVNKYLLARKALILHLAPRREFRYARRDEHVATVRVSTLIAGTSTTASTCLPPSAHRSTPWRMASVHRAGPADKTGLGFGSTHVRLKVVDPTDGQDDLFLVYLHLDSIAEGVIPGAQVKQGDIIGAVGQEDATYPHLHFEFRKGGPEQESQRSPAALSALPQHGELHAAPFGSLQFLPRAMATRGR